MIKVHGYWAFVSGMAAVTLAVAVGRLAGPQDSRPADSLRSPALENPDPVQIVIDYPEQGSIFPPEITAPTFIWHDPAPSAAAWLIEVTFADGSARIHSESHGEPVPVGEIDQRCIAETNDPPGLTSSEAAARSWKPDAAIWEKIKSHSVSGPAILTITGVPGPLSSRAVSRGQVSIFTSRDPVGAPIFYRDVPLMPTETEKGTIKPIVPSAVPFIGWRLRNVGESRSRLLLENLPTCANCHSFSLDGKTMGMDVDGPQNDKGMYTIIPVTPRISIRSEDVFTWNDFPAKPPGHRTIGFMAQVSPDGQHAVTTLNEAMYVVNFKDYRFLQVFYPTRGILAFYDRSTAGMHALPGADNPSFVQTDGVWTPDGKSVVFARAVARDPYPEGRRLARYAGDPNEIPIQYDLYRVPFNSGKGGRPAPIAGASKNGMSNTFPKVSPDGRWIVFVQCRNGQLMRPDGRLQIIPAEGGQPRLMRCNTPLMNSWHSFSPNSRWLVFTSKSRTPYTQMFLTHLDESGNDSPAILIENSTAANRAVNLPEFINIPQDGLQKIDVPAAEFYRLMDSAWQLTERRQYDAAVVELNKALALSPDSAKAHNNLGRALAGKGELDAAILQWQKALEADSRYAEARNNLGVGLIQKMKLDEAIAQFRAILEFNGEYAEVHNNLGRALDQKGKLDQALAEWSKALQINPGYAEVHNNLGMGLYRKGRLNEAIAHWQEAIRLSPGFGQAYFNLGNAYYSQGKTAAALAQWREGLRANPDRPSVLNQMARVLAASPDASLRNGTEAVEFARRAIRLSSGQDPVFLDTLAAAYAESGRFPEAVQTARQALSVAQQHGNQALGEELRARIALYEAGTPYREAH